MATMVLETPFDPQALFTALNYVSNVFSASSWQNLLKLFFMIALINGIISVGIYHKTDYIKQFLIALGFASVLSIPIGDNLAIKRSDTEKVYTINNSKAPFILVYTISTVNSVTKWFTKIAGASINSPNYTGMYDAGIGSNGNIIRNSMDMTFKDPKLKADMVQFIKECTLYDIRDGAVSMDALINNGNGFDLILNNTSPARFVSMNSTTGRPEVKTCQEASTILKGKINTEAQLTLTGKAANFFYNKDVAPLMIYSTAVQSSYQTQLNINSNVSQIAKQNMFNHLLEVSGEDIARLVNDPTMAESAAIHMGTARAAKKAAFQQSIIAQLGKDLLPSMSSWFAIIIIMLFPFVVLIFVVTQFNNMFQILVGYMGTLFWICCWQPIFAIINGLANWELGRQLAKTGAFKQEGIPYGYVHTVYDTLLNNHAMVGWMVILTPIIAGMVVYGTYRGFSHLGNSIFSSYQGAGGAVGNEMSDGNLSMGNTTIGNNSLSNSSQNTTSANKFNTSYELNSGVFSINDHKGITSHRFLDGNLIKTQDRTDIELSEFSTTRDAKIARSGYFGTSDNFSANKSSGHNTAEGISFDKTQGISTDKVTETGAENRKTNLAFTGTDNTKSNGMQTQNVIVIGNAQTTGNGTSNATTIHNGIGTNKQYSSGDTITTNAASSLSLGIGSTSGISGNGGGGNKGGVGAKGGILGLASGLINGGIQNSKSVNEVSMSGSQTTSSDTKAVNRDNTTVSHSDNSNFVNMQQQRGQVSSDITTRTTGSRHETSDSSYSANRSVITNHDGETLTNSQSARIEENSNVQKGFEQVVGQRLDSSFGEAMTKTVNLGLINHADAAAQWVHDNNKELFDDILKYHGISPEKGMDSYLDTRESQRRDLRLDFAEAQLRMKQNTALEKKPEAGGTLPTSRDNLNENYDKFKPLVKKEGQQPIQDIGTNYRPKK